MHHTSSTPNVGPAERLCSAVFGAWLAGKGLRRLSPFGALVALGGASLIKRGATGRSAIYESLGISTAAPESAAATPQIFSKTFAVTAPPDEALALCGERPDLIAPGDASPRVASDGEGRLAFSGSGRQGSLEARIDPETGGSLLTLTVDLTPSLDASPRHRGAFLASAEGKLWAFHYAQRLRQLKQWIETGETATTEGQAAGARSGKGERLVAAAAALKRRAFAAPSRGIEAALPSPAAQH